MQAQLMKIPGFAISLMFMSPAANTIVFGGLAVGNINAYWQAIAPGKDKYKGCKSRRFDYKHIGQFEFSLKKLIDSPAQLRSESADSQSLHWTLIPLETILSRRSVEELHSETDSRDH